MLFLAVALWAFGLADLVGGRRSEDDKDGKPDELLGPYWTRRGFLGGVLGAACAALIAALAGYRVAAVIAILAAALAAVLVWSALWTEDKAKKKTIAAASLAWLLSILAIAAALSSLAAPIHGPLADWYGGLHFDFVHEVSVDQFVFAAGALLFALATSNRIVIDTLAFTEVKTTEVQSPLKGGRFLGPMERLIVAAVILAGDPAAAAIVIAAKGLLRFPEITREPPLDGDGAQAPAKDAPPGPDENTEYFLIGTFSSLIVAAILALLVSAVS